MTEEGEKVWEQHFADQRQRLLGQLELLGQAVDYLVDSRDSLIGQGWRNGCTLGELADATGFSERQIRSTLREAQLLDNPLAKERRESRALE